MNISGRWVVRVVFSEQSAELSTEHWFALLKDAEHLLAEFGLEIATDGLENITVNGDNHGVIRSGCGFLRFCFDGAFLNQS